MKKLNVPQSGSQANTTASRNRFGQYLRNRRSPVNVNSPAQQVARANFAANAQAWGNLTDEQRLAWTNYAAQHPIRNSLGAQVTLTGAQMYNSVNNVLLASGQTVVSVPPAGPTPTMDGLSIGSTIPTDINIQVETLSVAELDALQIWCSPPMSPGRTFNNDFRLLEYVEGYDAGTNISIEELIGGKFGTIVVGQKYMIKVVGVMGDGSYSAPLTSSFVVS